MLPDALRLSSPPAKRNSYSWRASTVGYAVIGLLMFAMAIFTLFVKGRQELCSTYYSTSSGFIADKCSPAILTSGQRIQSPETAFTYTTVKTTNFTGPVNLQKCAMADPSSSISVLSSPTSNPSVTFNLTYVCNPADIATAPDSYAGIGLDDNSLVVSVESLNLNTDSAIMNTIRRINVNMTSVIVDGMYRVQGWQVFLNGDVNYMVNNYAAEPYVDYGNDSYTGPYSTEARLLLFVEVAEAIQEDLTKTLSPLADLQFPCQTCAVKWRGASGFVIADVAWSMIVSCAAVWALAIFAARGVMAKMEPESELPGGLQRTKSSERFGLRTFRTSPPFAPVYAPDAPPYSPGFRISDVTGPYLQISDDKTTR